MSNGLQSTAFAMSEPSGPLVDRATGESPPGELCVTVATAVDGETAR